MVDNGWYNGLFKVWRILIHFFRLETWQGKGFKVGQNKMDKVGPMTIELLSSYLKLNLEYMEEFFNDIWKPLLLWTKLTSEVFHLFFEG